MSAFNSAMNRIKQARIDADSLVQIFTNLRDSAEVAETEQAALTLGFTADKDLKVGDYIPTFTLSIVKATEEHVKREESPIEE